MERIKELEIELKQKSYENLKLRNHLIELSDIIDKKQKLIEVFKKIIPIKHIEDPFDYKFFGLIIAEPDNITVLKYEKRTESFIRIGSKPIKSVRKLLKFRESIVAMRKQQVDMLSLDLTTMATRGFNSIGAIYADRDNLYVGADGSLICFDYTLKMLNKLKLDFHLSAEWNNRKNVDDIVVYNNTAYLIDDIVSPLFVFRADVSDKNNIKLIDDYSFEGVNSHLSLQLINPEFNQWIIKEDYGVMGGSGEVLHIFSLSPKAEKNILKVQKISSKLEKVSKTVFSWVINEKKHLKGYRIKDSTIYPTHWAIILDINNNLFLAKLNTKNKRLRFSHKTLLIPTLFESSSYWYDNFDYKLKRNGDFLFISEVGKHKRHSSEYGTNSDYIPFFVYNVSRNKPVRINEFNLAKFGIEAVIDFIPIESHFNEA